jgi:hypothetical protein
LHQSFTAQSASFALGKQSHNNQNCQITEVHQGGLHIRASALAEGDCLVMLDAGTRYPAFSSPTNEKKTALVCCPDFSAVAR